MTMRTLLVVNLGILLAPGIGSSMNQPSTPSTVELNARVAGPSGTPAGSPVVTKIYVLRYYNCFELADLIRSITGNEDANAIVPDERSNRLIVTATLEQDRVIEPLIAQLDTPAVGGSQVQSLIYRVYMLELPSQDQNLKPFSVLLERSSSLPPAQVLDAAKEANVQIGTWLQNDEWMEDNKWALVIQGRAASNDVLKQMLAKIPDSQVRELRWGDENFTSTIPAAQVSRLPAPLQEHIRKFLGDQVQTMGYWFGNLSVPGEIKAPIGPWSMVMKAQSEQGTSLVLEVRVERESSIPFVPPTPLLSNTVQAKAGRPIIIGYNRDAYGTRVMGAMVILLESDAPAATLETKPPEPQTK